MARKKKNTWTLDLARLDELNHTELVQVARKIGYTEATRQVPKEDLIDMIFGDELDIEDPVDEIRDVIHTYIQGNQVLLSTLHCTTHCPTCPHERVINCFASNSDLVLPPDENPLT